MVTSLTYLNISGQSQTAIAIAVDKFDTSKSLSEVKDF